MLSGATTSTSTRPRKRWFIVGAVGFAALALTITALRPDPQFPFVRGPGGLAQLPSAAEVPYLPANQVIATVVMTLIGLVGVGVGVRMSLRGRTLLPTAVALSAALIAVPEVFYDVMGAVYFPIDAGEVLGTSFTILGRTMPVWIVAGWFGYGVFAVLTYALLESKPSTRTLWCAWGFALVGDILFEEVLLKFDLYHYYGNQPLLLLGELPWWWIPCNSVGVILAASIAYRLRDRMRGVGALGMSVIMPMSVTAIYGFIALPSWIAVNADYPWLLTQALGLATIALGVVAFAGTLKFVLNRDPFDFGYRPSDDEFASPL